MTKKNKYPVPLVQHLMDKLNKASWFMNLDLRSSYWQVRIATGDEVKIIIVGTCDVAKEYHGEALLILFKVLLSC